MGTTKNNRKNFLRKPCCKGEKSDTTGDCDSAGWPKGPAFNMVLKYAANEDFWLKHYTRAWTFATQNGYRRWWYWLWPGLPAPRASLGGLRQEVEARLLRVPIAPGFHRCGGALQRRARHALPPRAHRCGYDARQRGLVRHLPSLPRH